MSHLKHLNEYLENMLSKRLLGIHLTQNKSMLDELTLDVPADQWLEVCNVLRYDPETNFDQLIDLCGVDYLAYGHSEWDVVHATGRGFSRAVSVSSAPDPFAFESAPSNVKPDASTAFPARFAVVAHLLSVEKNWRIRVKTWCSDNDFPRLPSLVKVWSSVSWYEREAFDLFGILFEGHPDLRRILTDYGFVGHPLRKDFPLIGQVEMRYDPETQRVIYEPVSVVPRTLVPRVIRHVEPLPKEEPH